MSIPDYLYYNACIFGSGSAVYKTLTYEDIRSQPVLMDAENYRVSIISASIPTSFIPIRVMEIEPAPNTNINKTIYKIKMEYKGVEYIKNIIWTTELDIVIRPQDIPPSVPTSGEVNTQYWLYYALRTFSHFALLINNTLNSLFLDVKTANPAILSTSPPSFEYENEYFNIYVPLNFINDNIKIFFDYRLTMFFYATYNFLYGVLGTGFTELILSNYNIYKIFNNVTYGNYIIINQEFRSQQKFYSNGGARSIEILSPSFGTYNESIQNQDKLGNAIQGATQTSPILCDFHFDILNGSELRGTLIYNPTAQYRYMSFKKSGPITTINFIIRWLDNIGNSYDIFIPYGETCQIKFLFERIN